MKISIDNVQVTERIRKEITKIDELAADMSLNGMLNPITVMRLDGGEFRLLAGLRRLRAAQVLGWTEIEVNVVSPTDAEGALRIEISENEQREPFTYSEKVDFAMLIEEIETAKARERMLTGKSISHLDPVDCSPQGSRKSRDIIGAKIGMSGRQYDRAKFIAANATAEMIEQLDKGQRTITEVYTELRAKQNVEDTSVTNDPVETEPKVQAKPQAEDHAVKHIKGASKMPKGDIVLARRSPVRPLSARDEEAIRKIHDYHALPPEGKIAELQRLLREERARAAGAESELERLKELRHNDVYHMEGTIESLKRQNAQLTEALEAAYARIRELEEAK